MIRRLVSRRLVAPLLATACWPAPLPAQVAARVAGHPITVDAVDTRVRQTDPKAWQALYEARRQALDQLIDEELLQAEAARQNISRDSLVAREVTAKVATVGDSAVSAFFIGNQARMGDQSLEQMEAPIRRYLADVGGRQAWTDYLATLRAAAGVDILLDPPRVELDVEAAEPTRGPADAPVLIVEYSDFECPYCARVQPTVRQILDTYGDQVRLVYRDFPLAIHDHARAAAQAAQCAHEQGRFWAFNDTLFASQRRLQAADLRQHAVAAGLDTAAFDACLASGRTAPAVDADLASGERHGVSGTPAFFINGRFLSGAQPLPAFRQIIDEELDRPRR